MEQPEVTAVPSHTWTDVGGVQVLQMSGMTVNVATRQQLMLPWAADRLATWEDSPEARDASLQQASDEADAAYALRGERRRALLDDAQALEPSVPIAPGEVVEAPQPRRSFTTLSVADQKAAARSGHLPDIALSGAAGAGKDTAAAALVEQFGYTIGKFARPVYQAVLALNPYDEHGNRVKDRVERQGWEVVKRNQPEVRRLLQFMGTEVGRALFGENFWVEQAGRWRATISGPVVWTDTRFPNEVEHVARTGLWVHIVRPGQTPEGGQHASETSLPPTTEADYVLQNDGSVAALHARVLRVMETVGRLQEMHRRG